MNFTAWIAGGRIAATVRATINAVRAARGISKRRSRLTPDTTAFEMIRHRNGRIGSRYLPNTNPFVEIK